MIRPRSARFAFPTLALCIPTLLAVTAHLVAQKTPYLWGGKAPSLGCDTKECARGLDCSGYAEFAIYRSTMRQPGLDGPATDIQAGSVVEHDWVKANGFKKSSVIAAMRKDDTVRIAFLAPRGKQPGHVMLVHDGYTLESCGSRGVCRRPWLVSLFSFMARCDVYVLTEPPAPLAPPPKTAS